VYFRDEPLLSWTFYGYALVIYLFKQNFLVTRAVLKPAQLKLSFGKVKGKGKLSFQTVTQKNTVAANLKSYKKAYEQIVKPRI